MASVQGRGPRLPLEVSLLRWLARAELASRDGRPSAALAALRAGLGLVGSRRARMGSVDLQTGTAALGADLAAAGLRLALDRGSAPLVYAWLERYSLAAPPRLPLLKWHNPTAAWISPW